MKGRGLLDKGHYSAGLNRVALSFRNRNENKVRRRASATPQATREKPSNPVKLVDDAHRGVHHLPKWRTRFLGFSKIPENQAGFSDFSRNFQGFLGFFRDFQMFEIPENILITKMLQVLKYAKPMRLFLKR